MNHPQVAASVLFRIIAFVLLLGCLFALGGCSLFGIATKGNLNELAEQQELKNQELQTEVATSQQKMDARVTVMEDKASQFDEDLVRYETEIQSARLELQTIKLDLDKFEDNLDRAASNSQQAMQLHHSSVISERDRLRRRLDEIDALILTWEQQRITEPAGTITPVPGGLMVPEKELDTGKTTDASQASNETSVWNNRGSGASSR